MQATFKFKFSSGFFSCYPLTDGFKFVMLCDAAIQSRFPFVQYGENYHITFSTENDFDLDENGNKVTPCNVQVVKIADAPISNRWRWSDSTTHGRYFYDSVDAMLDKLFPSLASNGLATATLYFHITKADVVPVPTPTPMTSSTDSVESKPKDEPLLYSVTASGCTTEHAYLYFSFNRQLSSAAWYHHWSTLRNADSAVQSLLNAIADTEGVVKGDSVEHIRVEGALLTVKILPFGNLQKITNSILKKVQARFAPNAVYRRRVTAAEINKKYSKFNKV